jgi:teichuronic acid biosynthesis glycosyltransferase TuaG
MKLSKVSIITPTYNSSKYIEDTIKSIISQTYENWELLITDDCSTDETVEIIKKYILLDSRIKVYRFDKNSGSALARNNSIKFSKGVFLAFCDSDDLWDKDKLESHVRFHQEKKVLFSFTNMRIINENGVIVLNRQSIVKYKVNYKLLLKNNYIPTSTVLINKALLNKYKFPNYRMKQDYVLWLRILKNESIEAYFFDNCLTTYRKHKNQITNNKIKLIPLHFNILRKTQDLSVFKSFIYTLSWGVFGFYKHFLKKE